VKNKYGNTPNKKENIYFRISSILFYYSFFIINIKTGKIIKIINKNIEVIIRANSFSIQVKNKNNLIFL
jgi:uncharacterized protein YtpQ (UPF0354 family)